MGTLPQLAFIYQPFQNYPLARRQVYKSNPGPSDQNQSFPFQNPFVTQCLPMAFLSFVQVLKPQDFSILTHVMYTTPSMPISCHFPYSCHLHFSGFTLSFLLHFPCNGLHVTHRHFQMTKRVYHVPKSCIFPIYIKRSKTSHTWDSSPFSSNHHATMFSIFIPISTIHNFHTH